MGSARLLSKTVPGFLFPGPGPHSGRVELLAPVPWPASCALTARRPPLGLGKTHLLPAETCRQKRKSLLEIS